jgi:YhcH/YjgK/YiaL family protein
MIYARLERLAGLAAAPAALREAAALLLDAIARGSLPEGRSKLGDFDLIVSAPETSPAAELPFETHRRFVDLQVLLEGYEGFEVAGRGDCRVSTPYDETAEAEFYESAAGSSHLLVLGKGDAVVFFPEDAHKPRIAVPGAASPRKAVVKIPV